MSRENLKNCYFPKKSHHGYTDQAFQKTFYNKKEKLDFLNKHGFTEATGVSKAHTKRVKDFVAHCKNEQRKNPNWKCKEAYPD